MVVDTGFAYRWIERSGYVFVINYVNKNVNYVKRCVQFLTSILG